MPYLSDVGLRALGFKRLGSNVKISDKASIYNCDEIEIGDNSRIDDFCVISGRISIGSFVHITPQCLVAGGIPGITIDSYCTLAYGARVFAQSDDYSGSSMTNSLIPKKYKHEKFATIRLGRFSILGAGSIILPGAHIAEGVAIGAMSLVLRPTEEWKIYAGVPARIIRNRDKSLIAKFEQFKTDNNDPVQ